MDDDPNNLGRQIHGVKVLGGRSQIQNIMRFFAPHIVMIAMPSAESSSIRDIAKLLLSYNVSIKILPDLNVLLDGQPEVTQLRNLTIEDILHRPRVNLDRSLTASLLKGKRVMVTGAGGSIGSELCRQIASHEPEALILFERYENSLFSIHVELAKRWPDVTIIPIIGDVVDRTRVHAAMSSYAPQIVFHAAAHVMGTRILATLADELHVERFIMISTDKAVRPSSVMGATKRIAELLVQDIARRSRTNFTTVRFGNVLGSNGSVVPHFLSQIQAGGPVTVTHPDVQRYFMLIPEAVELVLQAAALADQGMVYVLEMGEQVRLQDLARQLIRMSGFVPDQEIPIVYTGLRPGEKLSEELVGPDEALIPSALKEIMSVRLNHVPAQEWLVSMVAELEGLATAQKAAEVLKLISRLVPSFQPLGRSAVLALERTGADSSGRIIFINPEKEGGVHEEGSVPRSDRPGTPRVRRKLVGDPASAPVRSISDRPK
jgi:FlaA1/EpsC-like NDP-sugar epimerase